jgi:hypothetical protein
VGTAGGNKDDGRRRWLALVLGICCSPFEALHGLQAASCGDGDCISFMAVIAAQALHQGRSLIHNMTHK